VPPKAPPRPLPTWYDLNARCEYHMPGRRHWTYDCYDLKHKIQDLIEMHLFIRITKFLLFNIKLSHAFRWSTTNHIFSYKEGQSDPLLRAAPCSPALPGCLRQVLSFNKVRLSRLKYSIVTPLFSQRLVYQQLRKAVQVVLSPRKKSTSAISLKGRVAP
jgi:hypothetical protein